MLVWVECITARPRLFYIQLDTIFTYPLGAGIAVGMNKSISWSSDKAIRYSIKRFGAHCPHLQVNKAKSGGGAFIPIGTISYE